MRTISRLLVGLVIVAALVGCGKGAQAQQEDIQGGGANAARTRVMPGPGPDGQLEIPWSVDNTFSQPVAANGAIYVVTIGGLTDVTPATRQSKVSATLEARGAVTGRQVWQASIGTLPVSGFYGVAGLTVDHGLVFVSGSDDQGALLFALDGASGKERWRVRMSDNASDLVADNGVVYAVTDDNRVIAVDEKGHTVRWRYEGGSDMTTAVAGDTVFVGGGDKTLVALDARTGGVRWGAGAIDAVCAVGNDTLYAVGDDDALYAFDATAGREKWSFAAPNDAMDCGVAVLNGVIYASTYHGTLYAIDAATGQQRWTANANIGGDSAISIADDILYFDGYSGEGKPEYALYAYDAATGTERWKADTDAGAIDAPIVLGGWIYIADRSTLYAIRTSSVPATQTPGAT